MSDRLTLKPTSDDGGSYVTAYDHPEFGKIDVGIISRRISLGNLPDTWAWSIRCTTLAPVYSPDHGKVPNDQRTWVRREAVNFQGTAASMEAAIAQWKAHWPKFCDARTEAEWRELSEDQNRSRKQILRYDYLRIKGSLRPDQRAAIEAELAAEGPPPAWLVDLIPSPFGNV